MAVLMLRAGMVFILLLCVVLPAQADELGDLSKRVAALEGSVKSLETSINKNASQISILSGNLNKVSEDIRTLHDSLKLSSTDLSDRMTSQAAKQQQILDQIMSTDENGEIYLTLSSIMNKSSVAREEVRKAVEQSIRTQGTLSIVNEMGTGQDIVVNHVQRHVQAGATLNVSVPVGTVTTQLPGQDIVNWTIGVPNYKQSVSIKPRYTAARVTTPSPISNNWVGHSVYYGSPVYETPVYQAPQYYRSYYGNSFYNYDYYSGNYYDDLWWGNYVAY